MTKQKLCTILSILLFPFGKIYAFIMEIRRKNYKNSNKQFKSPMPVLSVGNISWGGTGKTPIVEYLIDFAIEKSLKPIILTRGYGAKPPHTPLLIDPVVHKATECGDEPLMLAQTKAEAKIIVDPLRSQAAKLALEQLNFDLFILDDGFSHLKMQRDLDIVLLTKNDLTDGFNKVIPSGTWREPKSALNDASVFLIKAEENEFDEIEKDFKKKFTKYNKILFPFKLQALDLINVKTNESSFDYNEEYAFITGIGKPEQALKSTEDFTKKTAKAIKFYKDHHNFTQNDIDEIKKLGKQIICTHKDAIKLKEFDCDTFFYLKIKAVFYKHHSISNSFDEWLNVSFTKINKERANSISKHLEYKENTWIKKQ